MFPLCSGGPQPVPLQVLRQPSAEKADGGGGEGAEPPQLRQGAEATQGAIQSATTRFDAHPCNPQTYEIPISDFENDGYESSFITNLLHLCFETFLMYVYCTHDLGCFDLVRHLNLGLVEYVGRSHVARWRDCVTINIS